MRNHDEYIKSCLHPHNRNVDRNKGFQHEAFVDVLGRAAANDDQEGVRRTPGTDIADPYGSQVKPKDVPVWDRPPVTPEEEATYYGKHIHSESNPLGLHSHVIGGKPSGGHSHGPQNRYGSHHHKTDAPTMGITLDGSHVHDGANYPDGGHCHCPENFG